MPLQIPTFGCGLLGGVSVLVCSRAHETMRGVVDSMSASLCIAVVFKHSRASSDVTCVCPLEKNLNLGAVIPRGTRSGQQQTAATARTHNTKTRSFPPPRCRAYTNGESMHREIVQAPVLIATLATDLRSSIVGSKCVPESQTYLSERALLLLGDTPADS